MTQASWTVDSLADDLIRLGVAEGDALMVHTSMRTVGPVMDGADRLIDALERTVGPSGTIMMTLGAKDDRSWVNDYPEDQRAALLEGSDPFDCELAAADPDVGILAEVFRTRPGTRVSDHPEGRFAGSGRLADVLLRDVPWDDYYGAGSPLERLMNVGGRILRLGADLDTVTMIHFAEYLAPLPSKRRVRRHRLVATPSGPQVRVVETLDDCDGIVAWEGEDYFAMITREYLATGRAATGTVGSAASELFDAADLVRFSVDWMVANLGAADR